ncbi:acyl-CoA dehydrogenase family protein [Streptomyces prunicolor]|uniref:Acyl-CoA dehydrogenase family protein n=1 Tax=Streptomyces prunicolor TaxID=67348 RepID=A0ABU4FBU9_9ACTN|nr:acyl-CoA dehydrogenase family protein [Streptomyces prunicolor]MDV7218069.1 acyl-CoA dehydrogenase family protein [Streptomyces prunicolor]
MDHELAPEVSELRRTVRAFLERKAPESAVRRVVDEGLGRDAEVWDQLARQLGLHGLLVPEELGGQGTSFVEMGVVLEEMGRSLLPGPFFSNAVLAVGALTASGADGLAAELLTAIAEGTTIATVAFSEGLTGRPGESTATARLAEGTWRLNGQVEAVLDGRAADVLLVVAPAGGELGLFAVTADSSGLERTPLAGLDLTREFARVRLTDVEARRIGGDFTSGQRHVLALGTVGIAAELAGATQKILEMAVDYAKLREQFGKPIGSFQAVKHLCADIFVTAESALAVARYAARVAAEDPEGLVEAAALAKAYSSEACTLAAERNIQVHGGIGFTWEHPAHLYLRRIKSGELLFGDSAHHREELAGLLGLTAGSAVGPVARPAVRAASAEPVRV